ncbi:MAG TPA: addiction module protein [Ramlibacter sp.]|uniref:addiction module protein n=1 Tax=Ramlibacter sp. TaxID=1917967 RepID=UPI002B817C91|nr:addiction module protein [Ramlibacter sp.]HVZ45994.1 addiction module protein [Ramlibacter sp.]
MNVSLAKIEAEALQLPVEERVRLADHLLASIAGESDIEEEWGEEVERRLAEAETGAPFLPLEDAVARARRAIS